MPDREVKHSKTGRTNVRLPPTGTLLWPRWGRSASHRLNALELRSFSSARTRSVALNRTRMKIHYVNYDVLEGRALNFLSSRRALNFLSAVAVPIVAALERAGRRTGSGLTSRQEEENPCGS